jgi:Universal stress protein family
MADAGIAEAVRLEGERLRRSLAELAWFEVTRGDFIARVTSEVSESVTAVLSPRLAVPRPAHAAPSGAGAALVLYDGSAAGDRAVDVAVRMAAQGYALHVAVFADTPEAYRALHARAFARIPAALPRRASALPLWPAREPWTALAVAVRPALAVIGRGTVGDGPTELARIVDRLPCPLVVVG